MGVILNSTVVYMPQRNRDGISKVPQVFNISLINDGYFWCSKWFAGQITFVFQRDMYHHS